MMLRGSVLARKRFVDRILLKQGYFGQITADQERV
jgi:hypothetical protein